MLITTCTNCLARFRVTPQQLNAKNGQVRCGHCTKVFSGFEALERMPDDDTGSRLLAARELQEKQAAPAPEAEPPPREPRPPRRARDIPVVREPEDARTRDHSGDLGESSEDLPELEAIDVPTAPPALVEEHGAASARAVRGPSTRPLPEVDLEALEEEPETARLSRAWSFGVVLLLLVLGCELAYAFRAPLAQSYPPLRPWLESACARAGCTVPWPHDERLLKLEESELLEVPGHADQIALAARIRNLATVAQEYPTLELTFTDATGQLAARRVLRPADYLGHPPGRDEVLAAGAQVSIQLTLATPGIKPTGYELLLFYP
jgi:predicted Zn finger-like uncharacterized protein